MVCLENIITLNMIAGFHNYLKINFIASIDSTGIVVIITIKVLITDIIKDFVVANNTIIARFNL